MKTALAVLLAVHIALFWAGCTFDRFQMTVDKGSTSLSSTNQLNTIAIP
jgi:hypothetical protein